MQYKSNELIAQRVKDQQANLVFISGMKGLNTTSGVGSYLNTQASNKNCGPPKMMDVGQTQAQYIQPASLDSSQSIYSLQKSSVTQNIGQKNSLNNYNSLAAASLNSQKMLFPPESSASLQSTFLMSQVNTIDTQQNKPVLSTKDNKIFADTSKLTKDQQKRIKNEGLELIVKVGPDGQVDQNNVREIYWDDQMKSLKDDKNVKSFEVKSAPTSTQTIQKGPVYAISGDVMGKFLYGSCPKQELTNLRFGVNSKDPLFACKRGNGFGEITHQRDVAYEDSWVKAILAGGQKNPVTFYDSITNLPLFRAPIGRSAEEFIKDTQNDLGKTISLVFRNEEVLWGNVVMLEDGQLASKDGTFLSSQPKIDEIGVRYRAAIVMIAGNPEGVPQGNVGPTNNWDKAGRTSVDLRIGN